MIRLVAVLSLALTIPAPNCFADDDVSDPKPPFLYMSPISDGDYFKPVQDLLRDAPKYIHTNQESFYWQILGTAYSYVGRLTDGQKAFDRIYVDSASRHDDNIELAHFNAIDALTAITEEAKTHQVVMINEAHHVPETRGLTRALLKPLWQLGYRYLAAETFNQLGLDETIKTGYPLRNAGYYAAEPHFADIVREALRISFTLVAYEYEGTCDYTVDPNGCQDKRERGQAQNLVDRIFKTNLNAKVIIHAGYGHIDKIGLSQTFPWIPMAKYFKDMSGIDPLSVDQTTFRSHPSLKFEDHNYRNMIKEFAPSTPIVLKDISNGHWFTNLEGHYDMQVVLPQAAPDDGRSEWLANFFERDEVSISTQKCTSFPCLIEAMLESETSTNSVPFDQILIDDKSVVVAKLYLRAGKYRVRYITADNKVTEDMVVPTK